jgi:hypothetical protein
MQTVIQVVCKKGTSVRDAIVNDPHLMRFGLVVERQHQPGRSHGWAKLHSLKPEGRGAINIEWNPRTRMLLCRVVNRGGAKPSPVGGQFINYLLERRRRRIHSIVVLPNQ